MEGLVLNEGQRAVVAHEEGAALVLACPGSGKTTSVTERIVRRIGTGQCDPRRMVALTFTNKAAAEMRERIGKRLGEAERVPVVSTFHALGLKLLRRYARECGFRRAPQVLDEDEAGNLMERAVAEARVKMRAPQLMVLADALSNAGISVAVAEEDEAEHDRLRAFVSGWLAERGDPIGVPSALAVLRGYQAAKRGLDAVDFGDLITAPLALLHRREEVAERVRSKIADLTVDEAQDTNAAQYALVRAMAPPGSTVVMVGDDDQSIYRWRGARPENLRAFLDDYEAQIVELAVNYRCDPAIVTHAASLIVHNERRLDKPLEAARPNARAEAIGALACYEDSDAMAQGIACAVAEAIGRGVEAREIAVLYRVNALAPVLAQAIERAGIQVEIRGEPGLAERKEVKLMTALVRRVARDDDWLAEHRLAELVPGLGARSVARCHEAGVSVLDPGAPVPERARGAVNALARLVDTLRAAGPGRLIEVMGGDSLIGQWMAAQVAAQIAASQKRARKGSRRRPGLDPAELSARRWARIKARAAYMQRAASAMQADDPWQAAADALALDAGDGGRVGEAVVLSTVHRAKGLEWDRVHVAGFSEGLMPLFAEGEGEPEGEDLEEERSLAYVAVTRARRSVRLHHADVVLLNGAPRWVSPSRFCGELGVAVERQKASRAPAATGRSAIAEALAMCR